MDRRFAAAALSFVFVAAISPHPAANAASNLPSPAHIVIVIEENKSFTDVMSSPNAPFMNSLAARGALLIGFFALHHPSQPNYVSFFAGDTLGVCDDKCPTAPFGAPNLGASLLGGGKSFAGFAEDLPANANTVCKAGKFARKHCPWLDFSNVPSSASMSFDDFPTDASGFATLPTVSFVIPNLVNDMHNGASIGAEVRRGDDWLRTNLSAYATWAETNNSLLIVTWDEDSSSYTIHCPSVITTAPPKNHIATIVVGEGVAAGTVSRKTYTHQDLLRTLLDMYGLAPFGGATTARDIDDIWKTNAAPSATPQTQAAATLRSTRGRGAGTLGTSATTGCGDGLWSHVYHPNRLLVKTDCVTVTGTIVDATGGVRKDGVRHELDGDTHGWLKVDPEFEDMLNKGNMKNEHGNLVFELVCHFTVLQPDARRPCKGFKDQTPIPPIGTHVAVRGTFVQDLNHGEWNEIHPVSALEQQ